MEKPGFVMFNIFNVQEEKCDELLSVLRKMTEAVRSDPNFGKAVFHVSTDKKTIINRTVYHGTREQQAETLKKPEHAAYIQQCFKLADSNSRIFTTIAFEADHEKIVDTL